jgi:hypothetical protein
MGDFKGSNQAGSRGLSSIPGTKVVWESPAHRSMTVRALGVAQAIQDPACKDIVSWLTQPYGNLAERVVEEDYTLANLSGLLGYNPKGGQVAHFMKDEGQADLDAYRLSKKLILTSGLKAAGAARSPYTFIKEHPKLYQYGFGDRVGWGNEIAAYLAPGLHALQDSFSPAHVRRSQKNPHIILEIFAWDNDNKVTHSERDASWKNSLLGEISKEASSVLIRSVILSCRFADCDRVFGDIFERDVVARYLLHSFAGEDDIEDSPQEDSEQPEQTALG